MTEKIELPGNNPEETRELPRDEDRELPRQEEDRELPNPLNEEEASVGEQTDEVGEVDEFEMNRAEKSETLEEYPVHEEYDGPEPKVVLDNKKPE